MALPFEFALDGPPASQQARRRSLVRQWTQNVRDAAERRWDGSPPVDEPVMVSIFYILTARRWTLIIFPSQFWMP